jgi:hypothetical protein
MLEQLYFDDSAFEPSEDVVLVIVPESGENLQYPLAQRRLNAFMTGKACQHQRWSVPQWTMSSACSDNRRKRRAAAGRSIHLRERCGFTRTPRVGLLMRSPATSTRWRAQASAWRRGRMEFAVLVLLLGLPLQSRAQTADGCMPSRQVLKEFALATLAGAAGNALPEIGKIQLAIFYPRDSRRHR